MSVVGGTEITKNKWEKNPCQNIYRLLDNLTRVGRINLQIVSPSLLTSPCKEINDGLEKGSERQSEFGERVAKSFITSLFLIKALAASHTKANYCFYVMLF